MKKFRIENLGETAPREISSVRFPSQMTRYTSSLRSALRKWLGKCDRTTFSQQDNVEKACGAILANEGCVVGDYEIKVKDDGDETVIGLYGERVKLALVQDNIADDAEREGKIPQVTYGKKVDKGIEPQQEPRKWAAKRGEKCFVTFRVRAGKGKPTDRFAVRCRGAKDAVEMVKAIRAIDGLSHVRLNRCGQVIKSAKVLSGYKGIPQEVIDLKPKQLVIEDCGLKKGE